MNDVSVIVVNWNTRPLLASCLRSVFETAGDLRPEVIVVDNGSTDGSVEMVRRDFPAVRLIANQGNRGFVRANNQALSIAQGRYLLLLNSDAVLLPGSLRRMVQFAEEHPQAGIVGPQILNPDGSFQSSYMDFPTLFSELLLMTKLSKLVRGPYFPSYPPRRSQETRAVDWMQGACLLIRRETVAEIGGMDEDFFMYSEEVDWCWRARQAGWMVYYLPTATVLHWGGQSSSRSPARRRVMVYESKRRFLEKHHGPRAARLFDGALLVTSICKGGMWKLLSLLPRRNRSWIEDNVRSYHMLIRDLLGPRREREAVQ